MAVTDAVPGFECHEVDRDRWADFARLFEGRGGPKYCRCLAWRETSIPRTSLDNDGRRAEMERRVAEGVPVGLLGYLDGEPVAWCSVAPRETYRDLGGAEHPSDVVWSVVCFFIQRQHRGRGISRLLLDAAVEHARARGATVVEAYPVDPDSPSYRFMGFRSLYLDAGFTEVGRAGSRRYVMTLRVS